MPFRTVRILAAAAILIAGSARADEDKRTYEKLSQDAVLDRLHQMPANEKDRPAAFRKLLEDAGCQVRELPPRDRGFPPDFETRFAGAGERPILVLAHFHSYGAVDNWSGVAMLVNLCQSFQATRFRHPVVLAGAGGASPRGYMETWMKEPAPAAVLDLAALGVGPLVVQAGASESLLRPLRKLAGNGGIEVPAIALSGRYPGHAGELGKGPGILFHSLSPERAQRLRRGLDRLQSVNADQYYATYIILATYILLLDLELP